MPPGHKKPQSAQDARKEQEALYSPDPPPIQFGPVDHSIEAKDALKLNDEETVFILRQHLRRDQMDDPKVIRFVLSYMECRNQSQAAREAGVPGRGSHLRSRPEVHAAIEALTAKAVMKYGYDATEIIERVKEISALDPIEFENPDGSFKTHMSQIKPEARRAIKKFRVKNTYGEDANGMKVVIGQIIDVELWDKLKATEMLGREKNVMKETKVVQHDVTTNMASILLASKSRAVERLESMRDVKQIEGVVSGDNLADRDDARPEEDRDNNGAGG